MHHGLFEGACLIVAGLKGRQLSINISQDGGDGVLLRIWRERDLKGSYVSAVDGWIIRSSQKRFDLSIYTIGK